MKPLGQLPAPRIMDGSAIESEIAALDREFWNAHDDAPVPADLLTRRNALAMEIVRRRVPERSKGLERDR